MDFFAIVALVTHLVQAHWATFELVFGAGGVGALAIALRAKAYKEFFGIALVLAKEVAVKELDDVAARHALVDAAYDVAPTWVKTVVTRKAAEDMADKAFETLKG